MTDLSNLAKLPVITKFIERCIVTDIPAGALPKDITIQLPDADGAKVPVRYTGSPPGLAVDDEVSIRATPQDTIRYVIDGTSGATAPKVGKKLAHVLFVSSTAPNADHATIAAAVSAASAGDIILLDAEMWGRATITKAVTLMGLDPVNTILATSDDDSSALRLTGANGIAIRNLTLNNTGAGTTCICLDITQGYDNHIIDNVIMNKTNGAPTNSYGIYNVNGTNILLNNVRVTVTTGTNRYGYFSNLTTGSSARVVGGSYEGSTDDIRLDDAQASVELNDPILENGDLNIAAGSATGKYLDGTGDIYIVSGSEINTDVILSAGVTEAIWFDFSLLDTHGSGIASHFRDNDSSYPAGWTETDAAATTNTNTRYSFWYLLGSNAETSWKYRVQSDITLESLAANTWMSFVFGPIVFRDGGYTADLDYILGIYRNSGGIDESTYSRVRLHWDSGTSVWQIRGEEKDVTTGVNHDGTYQTLDLPIHEPLYIRMLVRNVAAKTTRQYWGTQPVADGHSLLQEQAPTVAQTWGQVWLQVEMSRGAGVQDYFYIGALDELSKP